MEGKISVITPTYNRSAMLSQAIESVLSQTYQNFELIIVDDYSTDDTEIAVQKYITDSRVKYYKNARNMGPGYNRNFGFNRSNGDYLVFLDDDDYYVDNRFFEKIITIYKKYNKNNLVLVAANAYSEYVETSEREKEYVGLQGFADGYEYMFNLEIKYHKPLSTFPAVFRKEALIKADFENMNMVNDYAIYLRALLYGNAFFIKDHVGVYRKHKGNISLNIKKEFMIQNLEEREWVLRKIDYSKANKKSVGRWWNVQMRVLYTYFVAKTNPKRSDKNVIRKWILSHSGFNPSLWIILILRDIKIKIKHMLGIKEIRKRFRRIK